MKIVTDTTIDKDINNSLFLLDFWAEWCGPCRAIAPILEQIGNENPRLVIGKIDADENPISATKFHIMSIPTLVLFKNGEIADRLVGYMNKERLLARLSPHL